MRNLFITATLILSVAIGNAQVYIQTSLPPAGLVQRNQLWNLVLINGSSASIDGRIEMVLRDRQSGNELLTATTARISLPKGSLSVNFNSLSPVQYNWIAMEPSNS